MIIGSISITLSMDNSRLEQVLSRCAELIEAGAQLSDEDRATLSLKRCAVLTPQAVGSDAGEIGFCLEPGVDLLRLAEVLEGKIHD
jgi:hypothetical protein